jgi:hypothetical protein
MATGLSAADALNGCYFSCMEFKHSLKLKFAKRIRHCVPE